MRHPRLWVSRSGSNLVARIDTTANVVTTTIDAGGPPSGMVFDGVNVWLAVTSGAVLRLVP